MKKLKNIYVGNIINYKLIMEWQYNDLQNWINNGCDVYEGLKIIKLDCFKNKLTVLPPEIGLLRNLQILICSYNELTDLPPDIGLLQNLKTLDCYNNKLTVLPPDIGLLQNLKILHCSGNKLTDLPPTIGLLQNLRQLYCSYNKLTVLPPEIGQLQNLQVFYCGVNNLTYLPPEIGLLQNLNVFYCSKNTLTYLPPEIGLLQNLQELCCSNNRLKVLPPEIGLLQNLQTLGCFYNILKFLPPEIGLLQNLKYLHCFANKLKVLPPEIGLLQNLKELYPVKNIFGLVFIELFYKNILMYSVNIRNMLVNLYFELKQNGIVGKQRISIIKKCAPEKFHMHSLYNWLKKIEISPRKKYKNSKITVPIENFVISHITNNSTITAKKIKFLIYDSFKVSISKTSIYSILKENNLTFKKTKIITSPYTPSEKQKQLKDVKNKLDSIDINNVVSIDEMSIVLNQYPSYGWSKKGSKCSINSMHKISSNKRFSLLLATSNKKIINYSIVSNGFKTIKFTNFIKKLHNLNNDFVFFMDNAIIHKSRIFNEFKLKNNVNVIYNAPYCSEYNPIECVFSVLRNDLVRNPNSTFSDINNIIVNFKKTFSEDKLQNMFNHCFTELNIFLDRCVE